MALVQRPLRGSRISTFYPVKTLPSLSSLDSAFQLQEYISLLIRLDVHDVDAIVSIPGRGKQKEKEKEAEEDGKDRKAEVNVDEACWKYEQLRRLAQDLSHPLITMLQQVCTRTTCPEMKAGEWLYLCVAHGNDGAMEQCCAIDYILHTLDSATALLNSPRAFPSRLQIPPASHRHFTSLARRLGRIFAHAYFHHREEFEQAEAESSLYARFLALTEKFDLVPADFLVIPPRAVSTSGTTTGDRRASMVPAPDVPPPTLLGAALHVDTAAPPPAPETTTTTTMREQSASPPGLDEAVSPRRYGRSRTDTMMLEGDKDRDGRFPASPASAAAEGPAGLDAALAAAGIEKMLSEVPAVAASPVVEAAPKKEEEEETPAVVQVQEEEEEEPERNALNAEPEREPPSPTSDEELAPPEGAEMPIISPSSSTAPQSETGIVLDLGEEEQEQVEAPVPVPTIAVVPATPPAVEEVEEKAEEGVEESVKAEDEPAPDEESAPAVETPAVDNKAVSAPTADEEVDVTDRQRDAEGAVDAATEKTEEAAA
ncbi:mps one binder kinase activator-like 4 [Mycena polygramma]|nr:mps one binder kinase activator-like 4 [Mycena polygramma]